MRRSLTPALLLALLASAPTVARGGWHHTDLPDPGGYAIYYLPAMAESGGGDGAPWPAVVFFHGAGGTPEPYRPSVETAAEAAGLVVVMPRSVGLGWGLPGDRRRLAEALAAAGDRVPLDPARTALAGHSAGGAWAYLLAYGEGWPASAVFTIAAPFYPLREPPPAPPPIRMLYGTQDPNYYGGARAALAAQWDALGIPWQEDVRSGYGHNGWPQEAMDAGFAFLAGAVRPGACEASDTALCLLAGGYRVEVTWSDGRGGSGAGRVVPGIANDTSGVFWFFRPDNWELLVKVLDGCAVNGHRWVFAAAVTNVAYTLTVREERSDATWSFDNPAGRPAPAVTDTLAFPCR